MLTMEGDLVLEALFSSIGLLMSRLDVRIEVGLCCACKCKKGPIPTSTTDFPNAGLMLAQRRRRWANISPALGQRVVFDGII